MFVTEAHWISCTANLGNINENSLEDSWNGKKYDEFRKMHVTGEFPKEHKCLKNCDQVKLFEYLK